MKFDVRRYYDNIDHDILKEIYKKAFGYDRKLYALLEQIIDSYQVDKEKGLPLGNQTSQWFALSYLDGLDRLIKEQLHIKYYSRYMDDGVLIHESREYLRDCKKHMEEYLKKERKMEFNEKTQIVPMEQGVDYLGFHFYLTENGKVIRRLRTSNKKRMKRKLKNYKRAYAHGNITQEAVRRSLVSYSGHLSHGHTYHLRKRLISNLVLQRMK